MRLQAWLPELTLPGEALGFAVDRDGVYVYLHELQTRNHPLIHIAPDGAQRRLLVDDRSHPPGPWLPAAVSIWNAPVTISKGAWTTVAFDLAAAPYWSSGAGADLSRIHFVGLQAVDSAGAGTLAMSWDDLRAFP
jgi:hypothetical protein